MFPALFPDRSINTLLRLCAAGLVLLGSLVPATAADSKLIVAMLPKSKGNAYFISVKAGADKAAKDWLTPELDLMLEDIADLVADGYADLVAAELRITIPGFYDDVLESSAAERTLMAAAPFDENEYKQDLGVDAVYGEQGYSTNERTGIRPTIEVNGIWGGYTGEGAKTVLPSKATAKISARLVPNQSSEKITAILLDYFRKIAPSGVTVKATEHHGGEPYLTPIDSKGYQAASKAIEHTFGKAPVPVRGGGSIPICSLFEKELGVKIVFMGFGLDSDNLHSPNEKYDLFNFYKGIETIPYFHQYFAGD
jgi:acetylornithine deacetylase/succinyl-diaminopimelate desuccinylase-like protein